MNLLINCDYPKQDSEAATYAEGSWGADGRWQCAGRRATSKNHAMDASNSEDTPLFMRGLDRTTTTIITVSLDITVAVLLILALDNYRLRVS